jgi:hypothetical protein
VACVFKSWSLAGSDDRGVPERLRRDEVANRRQRARCIHLWFWRTARFRRCFRQWRCGRQHIGQYRIERVWRRFRRQRIQREWRRFGRQRIQREWRRFGQRRIERQWRFT